MRKFKIHMKRNKKSHIEEQDYRQGEYGKQPKIKQPTTCFATQTEEQEHEQKHINNQVNHICY